MPNPDFREACGGPIDGAKVDVAQTTEHDESHFYLRVGIVRDSWDCPSELPGCSKYFWRPARKNEGTRSSAMYSVCRQTGRVSFVKMLQTAFGA